MKIIVHILLIILIALMAAPLPAQGVSRAQGAGIRLDFWNITGGRTAVSFNLNQGESNVDLSGVGPSVYYFSRAWRDLFLEMSLGVISGGNIKSEYDGHSDVRVESIVPFLAGLRYDFLSSRVTGALHPYLSFGGGPYTAFHVQTMRQGSLFTEAPDGGQGSVETRMEYGWYLGGGVNFVLTSWFAINADLKYNFIEIPEVKDYSGVALGIGTTFMWGKQKSIYEI
ncbi:outer membrane beta-barrel protein, partial [candidate division KSB1 bacterium]|nr:outer membrane beta-barrel protein [candidate division KSB1 bacterium]